MSTSLGRPRGVVLETVMQRLHRPHSTPHSTPACAVLHEGEELILRQFERRLASYRMLDWVISRAEPRGVKNWWARTGLLGPF